MNESEAKCPEENPPKLQKKSTNSKYVAATKLMAAM